MANTSTSRKSRTLAVNTTRTGDFFFIVLKPMVDADLVDIYRSDSCSDVQLFSNSELESSDYWIRQLAYQQQSQSHLID